MSGILNVDCEVLKSAVEQMQSSYTDFSTIAQDGFKNELAALECMNSDFVDKLSRVLEISQGGNLKRLNKKIAHYIDEVQLIYEEIRKTDETLAGVES